MRDTTPITAIEICNLFFESEWDYVSRFGWSKGNIITFLDWWQQPHRHYHTLDHLYSVLDQIEHLHPAEYDKSLLKVAALFHDVVYDPRKKDNEELSAQLFMCSILDDSVRENSGVVKKIAQVIRNTALRKSDDLLSQKLIDMDYSILASDDVALIEYERGIFKEYQWTSVKEYVEGRKAFLKSLLDDFPQYARNISFLMDYLSYFKPKVGLYAGSFNPFHVGHLNIVEKAERIFDKVIVAVGVNPDKAPARDAAYDLRQILPYHELIQFSCLLPHLAKKMEDRADVTIVKGLRNGYDLNYEINQLRFMQDFEKNTQVVYIPCDREYEHVSSSAIRGIDMFSDGGAERYVPKKFEYSTVWNSGSENGN